MKTLRKLFLALMATCLLGSSVALAQNQDNASIQSGNQVAIRAAIAGRLPPGVTIANATPAQLQAAIAAVVQEASAGVAPQALASVVTTISSAVTQVVATEAASNPNVAVLVQAAASGSSQGAVAANPAAAVVVAQAASSGSVQGAVAAAQTNTSLATQVTTLARAATTGSTAGAVAAANANPTGVTVSASALANASAQGATAGAQASSTVISATDIATAAAAGAASQGAVVTEVVTDTTTTVTDPTTGDTTEVVDPSDVVTPITVTLVTVNLNGQVFVVATDTQLSSFSASLAATAVGSQIPSVNSNGRDTFTLSAIATVLNGFTAANFTSLVAALESAAGDVAVISVPNDVLTVSPI